MATTVQIGAVVQTAFVKWLSMTVKLNTLDLILVDPATKPALGDAVTMTNPTWTGNVSKVGTADPVDRTGHVYVTIAATNAVPGFASAGPWGLSDTPNGSTTYGYRSLAVDTTQAADGSIVTHGSAVVNQTGLWPAMTFTLTSVNQGYAATNFSVTNTTVSWPGNNATPQYLIEFGDPLVTMSVWANSSAAGILPITTTKITDGAVSTPKLAAGSVTAGTLAAEIILSSLIKTAETPNARVELDASGFRAYDAANTLAVNIPDDDSPIYVRGQITATSIDVVGNAQLDNTAHVGQTGVMTVDAGISAPTVPPIVSQGWPTLALTLPTATGYTLDAISSGFYDSAGGGGGATAVYVALASFHGGVAGTTWHVEMVEWELAGGTIARQTIVSTGALVPPWGNLSGTYDPNHLTITGVTRLGSNWYIAVANLGTVILTVYVAARSTGVVSTSGTHAMTGFDYRQLANDGTHILMVAGSAVETWTTAPAFSSAKTLTGTLSIGPLTTLALDGTFWWIGGSIGSAVSVWCYTPSTGALVANRDFPVQSGAQAHSLLWDGSQFRSVPFSGLSGPTLYTHTSWDWTTAPSTYWVAYSWYDSAGSTTVVTTPTIPFFM